MMAADTMEALGISRGDYVVKVNSRKVLDGVLEAIGLDGRRRGRSAGSPCCARSTSTTGSAWRACAQLLGLEVARMKRATSPRGRSEQAADCRRCSVCLSR